MNDHRIDRLLTQHRKHLAHQQRELYHHNIDDPCPCELCARERYEHKATVIAIVLSLSVIVGVWLLWGVR